VRHRCRYVGFETDPVPSSEAVKSSALWLVSFCVGCGYPEFHFQSGEADGGEDVSIDTADTTTVDTMEVAVDTGEETVAADSAMDVAETAPSLPISCAALKAKDVKTPSGSYEIDPDGDGPRTSFKVYCEMSADGGGWTLAAKMDGNKTTWDYDSPRWTDDSTVGTDSTDLAFVEAKFRSFNEMPLKDIRVRMHDGSVSRFFPMALTGTSLRAIFSTDSIATSGGRSKWSSLVPDPSLQDYCNQEGTNLEFPTGGPKLRVRIGLVANNEMDCDTPDSFIGFGVSMSSPGVCFGGTDPLITVGNGARASCLAPKDKSTKLWGFLFIR
jgi:hypothetical protein